jgi:cell division protein FtsB
VEERARYELGMIKQGELFVQILEPNGKSPQMPDMPASTAQNSTKTQ